jgi:hypothetical protein
MLLSLITPLALRLLRLRLPDICPARLIAILPVREPEWPVPTLSAATFAATDEPALHIFASILRFDTGGKFDGLGEVWIVHGMYRFGSSDEFDIDWELVGTQ